MPVHRSLGVAMAVSILLALPRASAQAIAPLAGSDPPRNRGWFGLGWDPSFTVDAGASHEVFRPRSCCRLIADAALRAPVVLLPTFEAWQLALGVTGAWTSPDGFGASVGLHPDLRFSRDSTGTKIALGAALGVRPGYYARTFSATLDALWSFAIATHMAHSEAVEDTFRDRYRDGAAGAGPEDGWYAFAAHRLRVGAAGGLALARRFAVHASFGFAYTPLVEGLVSYPPPSPLPFYVNAGGAYRW